MPLWTLHLWPAQRAARLGEKVPDCWDQRVGWGCCWGSQEGCRSLFIFMCSGVNAQLGKRSATELPCWQIWMVDATRCHKLGCGPCRPGQQPSRERGMRKLGKTSTDYLQLLPSAFALQRRAWLGKESQACHQVTVLVNHCAKAFRNPWVVPASLRFCFSFFSSTAQPSLCASFCKTWT